MIEEKAYTRQEMRELLNTNANNQSIKRMLERRGYEFSFEGRGGNAVFTITKLPSKFKLFCFEELNVRPQTDFIKLRNFFYYYLDDEDFRSIFDFNTPYTIAALGIAVSEISEQILRDIEITIKTYERTHEYEERTDVHTERGLHDSGY